MFGLSPAALVGIGVAVLVALLGVQTFRIDALQADVRAAEARAETLQIANGQCAADVKAQNIAVEAWQAAAAAQAKASQKAAVEAEKRAATHENRAAGLRLQPPAIEGDRCESARLLLSEEIRGRRK